MLIDSQTNRPIPDAEIRIIPRNFALATFKDRVTTKTDAEGRFHFEGLEPIEYTGYVDGTSPKGTVLDPHGNDGLRFHYPNGVKQLGLTARPDERPARWEVVIHPGSPLKAVE